MNKHSEVFKALKGKIKYGESLAQHTTLKIGGPAEIYFEANSVDSLIKAVELAKKNNIPVTVIGWGSNVLISDRGIKGLVIVNMSSGIEIGGKIQETQPGNGREYRSRLEQPGAGKDPKYLGSFNELDYDERGCSRVKVTVESGVSLPYLMNYLIDKGITGLQWYSGIPGTVGGAVYNNIHGGTHFIGEVISSVKVLTPDLKVKDLSIEELGNDYDKSRFHKSNEIILTATFSLFNGDKTKAKYVVEEWAKRKSIQPKNSPGCAFANLTEKQMKKMNIETTSIGYVVEKMLRMTGFKIGDAEIYSKHHNFIINSRHAKASDYLNVIKTIQSRAKEELGVKLVPEIFFLGFEKEELAGVVGDDRDVVRKQRNYEIRKRYRLN